MRFMLYFFDSENDPKVGGIVSRNQDTPVLLKYETAELRNINAIHVSSPRS